MSEIFTRTESLNDHAEVWVLSIDDLNREKFARCESVLSMDERDRMQRFRCRDDRDAYAVAHGLARIALSFCYPAVLPEAWEFRPTTYGRPEICTACGDHHPRFNISHTRGMVACIVTDGLNCGVDIEKVHLIRDLGDMARRILANSEIETYSDALESERPSIFSRYWTLKEAYSKSVGYGLNLPFNEIVFDLSGATPCLLINHNDWHFEQWSPMEGYIAAVAIQGSCRLPLTRHLEMPSYEIASH